MGMKDYFASHILMHLLDLIRQEMGETLQIWDLLGFLGIYLRNNLNLGVQFQIYT